MPTRDSSELPAAGAAAAGLRHIVELTGKDSMGVTSVAPSDDGWTVDVEVVEDRRIPSANDVLALYEVRVDRAGTLLSYRRRSRYLRSRGNSGEGP
ncbi:gas vesicle protein GvpO [Micromonospora sp. CPCC 206061]|uniref:gas vesicle protein GvpO n=1 Tax=Micromonospora sp. CPCC 206061 TaxID=3122410 RepID=UPI002FF390CE